MRIKEGQIFNLMDTNGRRNDVINALQGYLTILDDIQNEQKRIGPLCRRAWRSTSFIDRL